jgi:phosphate transport system permease protein
VTSVAPAVPGTPPSFPGVASVLRARTARRRAALLYPAAYWLGGLVFAAAAIALIVSIVEGSAPALGHGGLGFLWSGTWNPDAGRFGAGILVVGTVVTTGVAMLLSVPIGLGVAVAVSEFVPRRLAGALSTAVEFLAAIPSIVVGLWALLVLSPLFARTVEPALRGLPVAGRLFSGPADGPSFLLASVVLAVMTLPTMVALSRSSLQAVPVADREAATALGATRWQVVRTAVLPGARSGIAAAATLAIGRALGESIAVALIIGNNPQLPHSLIAPGATLGSAIVNQFAEAAPGLQTASVIGLGLVLLILTILVNVAGQAIRRRGQGTGPPPRGPAQATDPGAETHAALSDRAWSARPALPVGSIAARSLSARRAVSAAAQIACGAAVVVALIALGTLLWYTVDRGAGAVSGAFLTHGPTPFGIPGGGIGPAITGTARVMGLALLMAVPTGLLSALLLYERPGRIASALRFAADVLTGVPSILVGMFAYTLLVETTHHFSTWAAAFALAVLMVPVLVRSNEEALRAVPPDLWEAGTALGASRAAVVFRVVIRQALPGLVTGNLLATARAVGETAPLLFTLAAQTSAITLVIFSDATQADSMDQRTAWGAAFVLLAAVLVLSIVARALSWWFTRRAQ